VVREGLAQPVLFLMSDHRGESDPEGARITSNFRSIFGRSAQGRRLQIVIRGANHYLFSDDAILKSRIVLRTLRALGIVGIDGRRQLAVTVHSLHSFFDECLMGAGSARMEIHPSLYPELQAFE
jgi:hypothetical protein